MAIIGLPLLLITGVLWPEDEVGGVALLPFALAAGTGLMTFLSLGLSQRRALKRLLLLARAPTVQAPMRWGAMDGRVMNGQVERRRKHVIEQWTRRRPDGSQIRGQGWVYEDSLRAGDLEIALDGGQTLLVRSQDAAFAAEETFVGEGGDLIEKIEVGDRVRVVGRPTEGDDGCWEVRSTGKDSLFVLGSRRRSPRSAALRAFVLHSRGWRSRPSRSAPDTSPSLRRPAEAFEPSVV